MEIDSANGIVRSRAKLDHYKADEVSIVFGGSTYSDFPFSVEVAFFKNGEWVTEVMAEFREYSRDEQGSTRVYEYVPINRIGMFIYLYGVK